MAEAAALETPAEAAARAARGGDIPLRYVATPPDPAGPAR
jgi:hypothetical protein